MISRGSVALIFVSIALLWGANWSYETFTPEGGLIRQIAVDPATPGNPVAINDYDVYVFDGSEWELCGDLDYYWPIAIAPGNGGRFTLISHDGNIYYSADGGEHWISVADLEDIDALSEVRGETLFVAANYCLYRSTNSGFSWEFVDSIPYRVSAIDLSCDRSAIFLGALAGSYERDTTVLLRSLDEGQTWTRIFEEPDSIDLDRIIDIETAPDSANWIFLCLGMEAGPAMNFLFSPDGGENWYSLSEEAPGLVLPSDVEFLSNDTVLVASIYSPAIYRGVWNGTSWEFRAVDSSANFTDICACGDVIYASSYQGVYVSADRGSTWERMNAGLHAFPLHEHSAVTNSVGNNLILLGEFGSSIYITHDGASWEERFLPELVFAEGGHIAPSDPEIAYICGIGVDITDSSWVFHSIYRSEDGGETWVPVDTSFTSPDSLPQYDRIVISPSNPNVLLSLWWNPSEDREDVYRSNDGGHNWTPVLEATGDFLFGTDTFFTMKGESLWVSYDTGVTWSPLAKIDWPWDMTYDPHIACVYVAEYFGVERISLNGQRDTLLMAPYGGWEDVSVAVAENSVLYVSYNSHEGPSCLIRLKYGETIPEIDTIDFRTERSLRILDGAVLVSESGRGFRKSEDAYLGLKEHSGKGGKVTLINPTIYTGRPELTVDCENPDVYELKIFNPAGRMVLSEKIRLKRGVNRIKVKRELPSGLYVLLLESKGAEIRSRFVLLREDRR